MEADSDGEMDSRQLTALCSALPYTQSLEALQLNVSFTAGDRTCRRGEFEATWIGYAIFHPMTRLSSWKKLTLRIYHEHEECKDTVIKRLASDPLQLLSTSKLAALEHHARNQPPSLIDNKFQIARLKQGSEIRSSPSEQAPSMIVLPSERSFEMCESSDATCCFYCVLVLLSHSMTCAWPLIIAMAAIPFTCSAKMSSAMNARTSKRPCLAEHWDPMSFTFEQMA